MKQGKGHKPVFSMNDQYDYYCEKCMATDCGWDKDWENDCTGIPAWERRKEVKNER